MLDGLEVLRRLRQKAPTPVLMLTARGKETDRVIGLELGADDYLTKPFSMREFLARIRAVLRRSELVQQILSQKRGQRNVLATVRLRCRQSGSSSLNCSLSTQALRLEITLC